MSRSTANDATWPVPATAGRALCGRELRGRVLPGRAHRCSRSLVRPAEAHGTDPSVSDAITGLTPPAPGVTSTIVDSVGPGTGRDEHVARAARRPRPLRRPLPAAGTRPASRATSTPLSTTGPGTRAARARVPPRAARPGAAPAWVTLSRDPSWAWFDPRTRSGHRHRSGGCRRRSPADDLGGLVDPGAVRDDACATRRSGRLRAARRRGGRQTDHAAAPGSAAHRPLSDRRVPGPVRCRTTARSPQPSSGEAGEPFARIDGSGVTVNLRSPVYVADQIARGKSPEVEPNASAPPVWRQVSDQSELRLVGPPQPAIPARRRTPLVLLAAGPTVLQRWSVPVRVGSRTVPLNGVVEWIPAADARAVLASDGVTAPRAPRLVRPGVAPRPRRTAPRRPRRRRYALRRRRTRKIRRMNLCMYRAAMGTVT